MQKRNFDLTKRAGVWYAGGERGICVKIGRRLEELMRLRGVRASEVARMAGVQPQTLYSILYRDSASVRPQTLRALARVLEVPLSYFYEDAPGLPVQRRRVPLLGEVAAGEPIFCEQVEGEFVEGAGGCDFALRVAGDSMEPGIRRGEIVFVKRQEDVLDGQIAVVIIDGEATLKRVYHLAAGVQLVSDNPAYEPMLFDARNSDVIRILGRAVSVSREL